MWVLCTPITKPVLAVYMATQICRANLHQRNTVYPKQIYSGVSEPIYAIDSSTV